MNQQEIFDICDQIYCYYYITPTTVRDCTNGDAQLVNGSNVREGRLEICINEAWGSVCSIGFVDRDAAVACAQMNFQRKGLIESSCCCCWFVLQYILFYN